MAKPTKSQKEKSNIERKKLIALSNAARDQAELILITTGEDLRINEVLIMNYKAETGCKTFKMFNEWKKEGFIVKKGETAYRVWGRPIKAKDSQSQDSATAEYTEGEENEYKMFPMCCVFNESQVEKMESTEEPAEEVNKNINAPCVQETHEKETTVCLDNNNPFIMTEYEDRKEAKKDRLEERAALKRQESNQHFKRSHDLVDHIPMGQPILIGHHSESKHRNTLKKSNNAMRKSIELDKTADHLESRAVSVGSGGISSDNPEALKLLNEKLENLVKSQSIMKAVNRAIKKGDDSALVELGLSESKIVKLKEPDFSGRIGFATYQLGNNGAEIRRTKKRIEELEKLYSIEPVNFKSTEFDMYIDDGRVRIKFHSGKPSENVREILHKHYSYKFSRYSSEWVRKATLRAVREADLLCEKLNELENIY